MIVGRTFYVLCVATKLPSGELAPNGHLAWVGTHAGQAVAALRAVCFGNRLVGAYLFEWSVQHGLRLTVRRTNQLWFETAVPADLQGGPDMGSAIDYAMSLVREGCWLDRQGCWTNKAKSLALVPDKWDKQCEAIGQTTAADVVFADEDAAQNQRYELL